MRLLLLTMLLSFYCGQYCIADQAEYPDPPPEVLAEGLFFGPDTLEFWHSKLSLPPSYFHELPEPLAEWLDKKQCRIAQPHVYEFFGTWKEAYPANCVQGDFDGEGPDDWAMILECQGELYLAIFWDGNPERGRVISLKYLKDEYNRDDYFKEKGIYNGYFIKLESVTRLELNKKCKEQYDFRGYKFGHDAIKLDGDYSYCDRDTVYYPVFYWDGTDWLAYDDEITCQLDMNWETAVMRNAASLPRIDLLVDFNQDTLSLPPVYFPGLPIELSNWLEKNKYRIPQITPLPLEILLIGPHNVISGNFDGNGEEDWAALVFRSDTIKSFVFFDADTNKIEQINLIEQTATEVGVKIFPINPYYHSFHFLIKKIDQNYLKNSADIPLDPVSGDTLSILIPWTHDAMIIYGLSDMSSPGTAKYYFNNKWYYF